MGKEMKNAAATGAHETRQESKAYSLQGNLAGVKVRDTFYTRHGKRILDFVICAIGLVFALPMMGIIAIITFFDVGAPVLFRQTRIGKDCKPFTIIKFKNMTDERDENGELLLAEYRVTKIGKRIRQTSLDELPQLFLILKGDMSIIGPRPLLPEYWCGIKKVDILFSRIS